MSFPEALDRELQGLAQVAEAGEAVLSRFKSEVEFAARLAAARPDRRREWEELILRAAAHVREAVAKGRWAAEAVNEAESIISPLGAAAKEYTVHCVGHAHIDMNWMWGWPETVATVNDTFTTVLSLMEEFPGFRFSQSQASVYQIMKDYMPELYAQVKQRVAEGRWEITANQWVEGDKNLASGEILCRHLLYTKRFMKEEFGLPYDAVTIDFEPDTFGHAHTVPTILAGAGVRRYYFCRAGHGPQLFWWQGKDGSRVLAFDDQVEWYLGPLTAKLTRKLFDLEAATGLKHLLFLYGVGDHGGGPTRRDLRAALDMDSWPIFPNVKLSTTDEFFTIAEREAKDLPVVDRELNFVFEGCYTSQSNIKRANRASENALVEAELAALLGRGVAGLPYPTEALATAWRHAMFSQFHDILPGSGVHATYEYAQGLYQEILARTTAIKTSSLRAIASMVNTAAVCRCAAELATSGDIGAGAGDVGADGAVSRRGASGACCDCFVVFNPSAWKRSELVTARIWDRTYGDGEIVVRDDAGETMPAQVIGRGSYWGHEFVEAAFPAREVEGLGYRSYSVGRSAVPGEGSGCSGDGKGTIENEFLKVEVEPSSGAIVHLIHKQSGLDLVPPGERLGLLEHVVEVPHGMTAWVIGQTKQATPLLDGATIECPHNGPWMAAVRARRRLGDSSIALTISLAAGVPRVDFALEVDWREIGTPETGVPALKVRFRLPLRDPIARFECPNGHVERPTDPRDLPTYTHKWVGGSGIAGVPGDVPAQKWADLTGRHEDAAEPVGAALLNDSKYGHSVTGSTIRLSLLRSSYDPDPLPELGRHMIRFALQPHVGEWSVSDSTRAGYELNLPLNVIGAGRQEGSLPSRKGFAEILTPNVMVSGMKKAEDSEALIVRLYEMGGEATQARVALDRVVAPSDAPAMETDLLEQPLPQSSAVMEGGVLRVGIPAFGIVTVKIG